MTPGALVASFCSFFLPAKHAKVGLCKHRGSKSVLPRKEGSCQKEHGPNQRVPFTSNFRKSHGQSLLTPASTPRASCHSHHPRRLHFGAVSELSRAASGGTVGVHDSSTAAWLHCPFHSCASQKHGASEQRRQTVPGQLHHTFTRTAS